MNKKENTFQKNNNDFKKFFNQILSLENMISLYYLT